MLGKILRFTLLLLLPIQCTTITYAAPHPKATGTTQVKQQKNTKNTKKTYLFLLFIPTIALTGLICYNTSQPKNNPTQQTRQTTDKQTNSDSFIPSGDTWLACMQNYVNRNKTPIVFMGVGDASNAHQQDNPSFKKLIASNPNNANLPQLRIHIDPYYKDLKQHPTYLQNAKTVRTVEQGTIYQKDNITAIVVAQGLGSNRAHVMDIHTFEHTFDTTIINDTFWPTMNTYIQAIINKKGFFCFLNAAISGTPAQTAYIYDMQNNYHKECFKQLLQTIKKQPSTTEKKAPSKYPQFLAEQGSITFKTNTLEAYYAYQIFLHKMKHWLTKCWTVPEITINYRILYPKRNPNKMADNLFSITLAKPHHSKGEYLEHFPEIGAICYHLDNDKNCVIIESSKDDNNVNHDTIYYHLKKSTKQTFQSRINKNNYKKVTISVAPCTQSVDNLRLSATNEVEVV